MCIFLLLLCCVAYCIDCACFCYSNKSVQFLCLSNFFSPSKFLCIWMIYQTNKHEIKCVISNCNFSVNERHELVARTHRENIGSIFANCCFAVRWNYDRLPMIKLGQWFISKCEALEEFQNNDLTVRERRLHQKNWFYLKCSSPSFISVRQRCSEFDVNST